MCREGANGRSAGLAPPLLQDHGTAEDRFTGPPISKHPDNPAPTNPVALRGCCLPLHRSHARIPRGIGFEFKAHHFRGYREPLAIESETGVHPRECMRRVGTPTCRRCTP